MNNTTVTISYIMKLKDKDIPNSTDYNLYFNIRDVEHYNRFSVSVVISEIIDSFKSQLGKYFQAKVFIKEICIHVTPLPVV